MAPRPKGSTARSPHAPRRREKVASLLDTPLVPIEQVQVKARALRPLHPTLDDETTALCVAHISTRYSIKEIARQLGASYSWCYARIARPDVQAFLQQLAMTSLGVAAARSIQSLEQLAHSSPDERTRLEAATQLLDRAGLGNTTAQVAQGNTRGYAFSFAAPPPAKEP